MDNQIGGEGDNLLVTFCSTFSKDSVLTEGPYHNMAGSSARHIYHNAKHSAHILIANSTASAMSAA